MGWNRINLLLAGCTALGVAAWATSFTALMAVFVASMFLAGFLLRRELLKSVVHERLATNAPVNIMMTDLDLNVTYANRRSIDTLKTIEYAMPCKAEDIVGKCIDMFHKNPGRIRKILADPANLPHKSTIQIGNDWMAQTVVAVRDGKGKYIGPMLTWELVTGRLEEERKVAELKRELAERVSELQEAAGELNSGAEQILSASRTTAGEAQGTASAVEELDRQISVVAASAEEMSASVGEIARNVAEATQVAKEAGRTTSTVNTRIKDLGLSSSEISKAVNVINDIADQTKLLALNATIEAARAGEAGKGFAVVAGEVKELAKQTGIATEEIGRMVEDIQRDVSSSIEAMGKVKEVVERIESIQTSIAAAIEQQNATSGEIARSAVESSRATRGIRSSVESLSAVSESGSRTAESSKSRSSELATLARRIASAMKAFGD
ncbi:MAG TPA: methyl-accepting chemotaxis protein [Fibrobacteria bacterium]|nr:methyl-accepting chemotaxis protein [Fibrobacteria bacterium]